MSRPSVSFEQFATVLSDAEQVAATGASVDVPGVVAEFLAALKLLHGVPLQYLIPDPRMLAPESLRFFHIDFNWLVALVDGAYSPGRATGGDLVHETAGSDSVHAAVRRAVNRPRENDDTRPVDFATGFLLRSAAVSGWPGLEVEGYAAGGGALPLLRMERLGDEILFCLFHGVLAEARLHEPAESLHFGFDVPDAPAPTPEDFTKQLKYLINDGAHRPGDPLSLALPAVPLRPGGRGVVDVARLVTQMRTQLDDQAQLRSPGGPIDAAEFALQMTEGVGLVKFKTEN